MSSERQTGTVKSVAAGNVVVEWPDGGEVTFRAADFAARGITVPQAGQSIEFYAEDGNALSARLDPERRGGAGETDKRYT